MTGERERLRRIYLDVWRKHQDGRPLEPLEGIIAGVLEQHPEYHGLMQNELALAKDYSVQEGQANPFLHMGMHIALHEQLAADRPSGIRALYQRLLPRFPSPHDLEHRFMECLGESLWHAQGAGPAPDEARYLECIRRLDRVGGIRS